MHRLERLDDVDLDRPHGEAVRIVNGRPGVTSNRWFAANDPELQRIELSPRRKPRHRENDHVAYPISWMDDEEKALAPVRMVRDDALHRLWNLVDEEFVHVSEAC